MAPKISRSSDPVQPDWFWPMVAVNLMVSPTFNETTSTPLSDVMLNNVGPWALAPTDVRQKARPKKANPIEYFLIIKGGKRN